MFKTEEKPVEKKWTDWKTTSTLLQKKLDDAMAMLKNPQYYERYIIAEAIKILERKDEGQ